MSRSEGKGVRWVGADPGREALTGQMSAGEANHGVGVLLQAVQLGSQKPLEIGVSFACPGMPVPVSSCSKRCIWYF